MTAHYPAARAMIAALDHPAPPPTTPASSIAATPPATPITDTRREGMLHRAVRDAALAPLRAVLIVHPESVRDVDRPHRTALHLAADQGHATLAVHLLDARADPNARGRQGFTPADCAKYLATRNAERAPGCLCTLAVLYTLHAKRSRADEGADPANFILVHQRCAEAARRMALTVPWLDEPWASATAPPGKALPALADSGATDPPARATEPSSVDPDPWRPTRDPSTHQALALEPSGAPTLHDTAVSTQCKPANPPHLPTMPTCDDTLATPNTTAAFPSTPTATRSPSKSPSYPTDADHFHFHLAWHGYSLRPTHHRFHAHPATRRRPPHRHKGVVPCQQKAPLLSHSGGIPTAQHLREIKPLPTLLRAPPELATGAYFKLVQAPDFMLRATAAHSKHCPGQRRRAQALTAHATRPQRTSLDPLARSMSKTKWSVRMPYARSPRYALNFVVNHLHTQTIGSGTTFTVARAAVGPMHSDRVSSGTGATDKITADQ